MATPTPAEMLTAEEVLSLNSALENPHFVTGLQKIFAFEEKYHTETMRNGALAPIVNTGLLIAAAASARSAIEMFDTIRKRMSTLTTGARR